MGWILDWFVDSFAQSYSRDVGRKRPSWVELAVYLGCLLAFGLATLAVGWLLALR